MENLQEKNTTSAQAAAVIEPANSSCKSLQSLNEAPMEDFKRQTHDHEGPVNPSEVQMGCQELRLQSCDCWNWVSVAGIGYV